MKRQFLSLLVLSLVPVVGQSQAMYAWGSMHPEARDREWRVYAGSVMDLSGHVNETFRPFYAASGQDAKQALAESYDVEDFGIECPYLSLGFQFQRKMKYWGYRWNFLYFDVASSATAKRDYYIGVGEEIEYNGIAYEHLKIPKGSEFDADLAVGMTEFLFSFTPFTFVYGNDHFKLVPSIDLGIVLLGGKLDIDAGETTGVTTYQNPPVEFAVGGEASSYFIAGAPKVGIGADFYIGPDDGFQFILHGDVGYFAYDGSSKPFTGNSHREKNIDVSYLACTGEAGVAIPFSNGTAMTLGVRVQVVQFDGSIKSKETEADRIIAARERFDKEVEFSMTSALFYIGYTF